MEKLYTEEYLAALQGQIRRRRLVLLAIIAVCLVGLVLLLMTDNGKENRPVVPATLALILTGAVIIFFWDMLIRPLTAYARHVDASLHGRFHETTVVFDHLNEETSMVEGVAYRDLIFLGEADKHGDRDRMFYWDQELPLPDFKQGQEISVQYFDRFITGYQVL